MEKYGKMAATAGLGKYHTGGYGRIGVYRVKYKYNYSFVFQELSSTLHTEYATAQWHNVRRI